MERWSKEKANAWWAAQKWAVGCNYVPSYAVNDVELWMDETFSPEVIAKELRIARELGLNSLRVFLSYTVWQHEGATFEQNFERFLCLAAENRLSVMPVLFDDCAFDGGADPVYGPQPQPRPGIQNSRWVPSPGATVQDDPAAADSLREYVHAIIGAHREDARILCWDLYNEPGNEQRWGKSIPLLENAFLWAREAQPGQPLTVGMWWFEPEAEEINRICAEQSDIISIHSYTKLDETKKRLAAAEAHGRPVFVTEWLVRQIDNGFFDHLPLFKEKKVGAWHWGLIVGKTQTNLQNGLIDPAPQVWQHDLMTADGVPYDPAEPELLRRMTRDL